MMSLSFFFFLFFLHNLCLCERFVWGTVFFVCVFERGLSWLGLGDGEMRGSRCPIELMDLREEVD